MNQEGSVEAGLMLAPLALLLAGIMQIGLLAHVHDVLVSVASDAARAVAISGDSSTADQIVHDRGSKALGGVDIAVTRIGREQVGGTRQVAVELRAPLPFASIFGVHGVDATAHAVSER